VVPPSYSVAAADRSSFDGALAEVSVKEPRAAVAASTAIR
jgi:hypothetical protein